MYLPINAFSASHYCVLTSMLVLFIGGCSTPVPTELPHVIESTTADENKRVRLHVDSSPNSVEVLPAVISGSDTLIEQTFLKAKTLVEEETNTRLTHIKLQIVSGSDIHKEVKRESRRLVQSQFPDKAYAEKFLKRMVDGQANSYAALYTNEGHRVLVNRDLMQTYLKISEQSNTSSERALLALLIHELVHAADDTKYQIHKNRVMNFKISFTQSAAFEGHAQLVTRKICKQHDCLNGMQALDDFMFAPADSSDPVLQSVQAISRNVLEYSYIEGERFLTELQRRPNGEQLIEHVLRNPPEDPIQILVPSTYPDTARESRNRRLRDAVHMSRHLWTEPPFRIVETSPIKGINIRNRPERRSAAVEGFTRLITAMESAQIYNQSLGLLTPIELTLLEAENDDTATMFAESFVQHAIDNTGQMEPNSRQIMIPDSAAPNGVQPSLILMFTPDGATEESLGSNVMVAIMGRYVLQLTATDDQSTQPWAGFAESVFSQINVK